MSVLEDSDIIDYVLKVSGASSVCSIETMQALWSGYGKILRVHFSDRASIVVKRIVWPEKVKHPRGWASYISHQRKVKSYDVEIKFYQQHAPASILCHTPGLLTAQRSEKEVILVLEDLNTQGFTRRPRSLTDNEIKSCVVWLANFHAHYMGKAPAGLWEVGTYWHLDTRPNELKALKDITLKNAASKFDRALLDGVPQTFVHGDAKVANFCFAKNGSAVAAVDFQYVGGGCGMKDLAYFMSSCLNERECEKSETWILDHYFQELRGALTDSNHPIDLDSLEESWRRVYPIAWADFYRFLEGWSPGHWKVNGYSQKQVEKALEVIS